MMCRRQLATTIAAWLGLWARPIAGAGLYAYNTDRTVQVAAQDPESGDIWYSNCNSETTPIFPLDKPNVLPVKSKARNGTALTAAGWWDTQKIIASVFYQTEEFVIVNGYFECDMESGKFIRKGEYPISETAQVDSVHQETGLSVSLLGSTDGYRVFYHNEDRQLMMMSYTADTNWIDGGAVSLDKGAGPAIGSGFYGKMNISAVMPRGQDNMEVTRFGGDDKWHLAAFPQPLNGSYTNNTKPAKIEVSTTVEPQFDLPAWDPKVESIALAVDSSRDRSIFYIGSDSQLYQVTEEDSKWKLASNQTEKIWPTADNSSAGVAVAYQQSSGETWVYYWSNSSIIQAHRKNSQDWESFTTLHAKGTDSSDDTGVTGGDDSSSSDDTATDSSTSSGLSTGAKAGIGVGVSLGAIIAGGLIFFFLRRRAKSKKAVGTHQSANELEAKGDAYDPATATSSPPPQYAKEHQPPTEMDTAPPPAELPQPPVVYELPVHHGR
ncbi:hypothetical protein FDECE_1355 [Fusarium decemcellulare]|nr:hypothetical protein FDECE_1355 [Fusarium decemcellulare]